MSFSHRLTKDKAFSWNFGTTMPKSLTIGEFLADYSMETTEYRDKLELVSTDQTVIEDFVPPPRRGRGIKRWWGCPAGWHVLANQARLDLYAIHTIILLASPYNFLYFTLSLLHIRIRRLRFSSDVDNVRLTTAYIIIIIIIITVTIMTGCHIDSSHLVCVVLSRC